MQRFGNVLGLPERKKVTSLIGQRLYTDRPFLNMSMGPARGYVRLKLGKLRREGARPERPTNALVPLTLRVAQR